MHVHSKDCSDCTKLDVDELIARWSARPAPRRQARALDHEVTPVPDEVSLVPDEDSPVPDEVSPVQEDESPVQDEDSPVQEDESPVQEEGSLTSEGLWALEEEEAAAAEPLPEALDILAELLAAIEESFAGSKELALARGMVENDRRVDIPLPLDALPIGDLVRALFPAEGAAASPYDPADVQKRMPAALDELEDLLMGLLLAKEARG